MSYSNFRKLFKEYTGLSQSLSTGIENTASEKPLATTGESIKEIAYRLHFESPDYFSARFRAKTGMRPSAFRDKAWYLYAYM